QQQQQQQQQQQSSSSRPPKLLVTACPRKRFSNRELEALAGFVRGGRGSLHIRESGRETTQ
ncbi:MAG: hypothetical protein ACO4BJ_03385, partial [Planctomycetota bacterium]